MDKILSEFEKSERIRIRIRIRIVEHIIRRDTDKDLDSIYLKKDNGYG